MLSIRRLRGAGDVSEVTMQFALRLWIQLENNNVSKNIHVMVKMYLKISSLFKRIYTNN
jgi:hypothetical protein